MSDADVKWIATLSDGTTAVENKGFFQLIPGGRTPWVQLCRFTAENGLHLTSLRLNFRGRTIHMPRPDFDRFGLDKHSVSPLFYSLQYHVEAEMGEGGAFGSSEKFVDLIAEYPTHAVHYIQDLQDGNNSWVVVTQGYSAMASTPRRLNDTS